MTQKYTGSSEKFTAEKSAAHRRNARRISARQFSLGVQRQVLNRLSAGRQGREHGNGPQNCGSTGFRRRRAGRASKKTTTKQPGMREEDSAMRVHQQTMRAHQIEEPPASTEPKSPIPPTVARTDTPRSAAAAVICPSRSVDGSTPTTSIPSAASSTAWVPSPSTTVLDSRQVTRQLVCNHVLANLITQRPQALRPDALHRAESSHSTPCQTAHSVQS